MTLRITPEDRRRLEALHLLEPLVPKGVKPAKVPHGCVRCPDGTYRRKNWIARHGMPRASV